MTELVGIMFGGIALAACVTHAIDGIAARYETRTGRDWTTGERKASPPRTTVTASTDRSETCQQQ